MTDETPMKTTRKPGLDGNRNALRHGLKSGKLPAGCQYVENRLNAFRRQLEDQILALRGEITLLDAANIQTAIRWERHGCLAQLWLRMAGTKLKPMDQLNFSREIARASTERDRALERLSLVKDTTQDAIDALYIESRESDE
jgi:hypothetical protein